MIKEGDVIEFSSNRLINELQTLKELSGVLKISFSGEGNGMISCRGVEENGRREYSCEYTDVIVNGNDQKSENFNSSKKYKAGTTIHQGPLAPDNRTEDYTNYRYLYFANKCGP